MLGILHIGNEFGPLGRNDRLELGKDIGEGGLERRQPAMRRSIVEFSLDQAGKMKMRGF